MGNLLNWYVDRWQWAGGSGFLALVLMAAASLVALALAVGMLGGLLRLAAFAASSFSRGFAKGWRDDA